MPQDLQTKLQGYGFQGYLRKAKMSVLAQKSLCLGWCSLFRNIRDTNGAAQECLNSSTSFDLYINNQLDWLSNNRLWNASVPGLLFSDDSVIHAGSAYALRAGLCKIES